MKVKCINSEMDNGHVYGVIKSNTYLVLGISVLPESKDGSGIIYEILNDSGTCRGVPAILFEIVDKRCSQYWRAELKENGGLVFWPEEFFIKYFHDDLSEGLAEAVSSFESVVARMKEEFDQQERKNWTSTN